VALIPSFSNNERGKLSVSQQYTLFFKWEGGGGILNEELHQRSQISASCHGQKRSMQGPDSGAYKNFHLGFNVNVQNLFLLLNAVWLLHITFN